MDDEYVVLTTREVSPGVCNPAIRYQMQSGDLRIDQSLVSKGW